MRYTNVTIAIPASIRLLFQFVLLSIWMGSLLHAQISTDVRVLSAQPSKSGEHGTGNERQETWVYKTTLQNTGIKDLADLEVRYRIYQYTELNANHTPASPVSLGAHGEIPLPVLKSRTTSEIKLHTMDFAFGSARVDAAKEIFQGVWIRVFTKEGKEIGSLVKPPSLAKKMPWK